MHSAWVRSPVVGSGTGTETSLSLGHNRQKSAFCHVTAIRVVHDYRRSVDLRWLRPIDKYKRRRGNELWRYVTRCAADALNATGVWKTSQPQHKSHSSNEGCSSEPPSNAWEK